MAKLTTGKRNKLPKKDFAEPGKRAYPIEDKPHARNAKARASPAVKAGRMSKAEERKIDEKADEVSTAADSEVGWVRRGGWRRCPPPRFVCGSPGGARSAP
jgi:hypothetical protein